MTNNYSDKHGPSGRSAQWLRRFRETSVRIIKTSAHSPTQNLENQASLTRNFGRAAEQPSGVSGKGNTSGDPGRARIISFDLARGFTVLLMPMIHVVMLYSTIPVQQSLLGDILGFIAEGPGAQLFMLLMGVNFALKRSNNSPLLRRGAGGAVLQRTFYLLLAAYLLNIFKFIVPLGLLLLPENLLQELQIQNDFRAAQFFFLIGDILHFAAIAYLVLYVVTRSRYYPYIAILLAIAIVFLSPSIWDLKTGIAFVDQVLVLFNGHPPQTFFPVFPWLVYPLIGLTLGFLLKTNHTEYILRKTGIAGIAFMIISLSFPATTTITEWLSFYRTAPADTIFHIGFVLLWLCIFHWLNKKIKPNPFFTLLTFCSKNITAIYIIQWILICWCMAFTGYLQLGFWPTMAWMSGITVTTLITTWLLQLSKVPHRGFAKAAQHLSGTPGRDANT